MDYVGETIQEIKNMKPRKVAYYVNSFQFLMQVISLGVIVGSALSIWKTLMIVTLSESPVVVVLSGSMEPAYYRGDILFLSFFNTPIEVGDVVVYKIRDQDIPIVHRAIQVQQKYSISLIYFQRDGGLDQYILTKGDNNQVDDRMLYPPKQIWLHREDLMGRINGYLPHIGYITILLNDYPPLKFAMIGLMSLFVITAKDPQS